MSSAVSGWHRGTLLIRPVLAPLDIDCYSLSVARPSIDSSSRCISGGGVLGPSSTTSLRMVMALPLGGLSSKEAVVLALIAFQGAFLKSSLGWTVCSGTVTAKVVSIGRWSEPCSVV
jgi:hypothetical protein